MVSNKCQIVRLEQSASSDRLAAVGGAVDRGFEPVEVDGFGQVVDEAGFAALAAVFFGAEAAHGDAEHGAAGAELAHQVQAVAVGQLDIGEEEIEGDFGFIERGAGGGDAVGGHDVVAALAENGREVAQSIRIVFDHEDAKVGTGRSPLWASVECAGADGNAFGGNGRQLEAEGRAEPAAAARGHEPAAQGLGERTADRQAQSQAAGPAAEVVVVLLERLEDSRAGPAGSMPMPVSSSSTAIRGGWRIVGARGSGRLGVRIVSRPLGGVNLAALWIRFQTICMTRAWSAVTWWCGASSSVTTSSPATKVASRQISIARRIASWMSMISRSSRIRPRLNRERFSRSSIKRASSSMLRWIISRVGRSSGDGVGLEHRRDAEEHGRQRRAELVAEHGDESVLGLAGGLGQLLGVAQLFLGPLAVGDVLDDEGTERPVRSSAVHIGESVAATQARARGAARLVLEADRPAGCAALAKPLDPDRQHLGRRGSSLARRPSSLPVATPKNLSVSALAEMKRVSSSVCSMTPMAIADDS